MNFKTLKSQVDSAKRFRTPVDVEIAEALIKIVEAKEKEIEELKKCDHCGT
jgi:hypothetical protein